MELTSRSARATEGVGRRLARGLAPGAVIALVGPLGAGKTCLVRGLCRGLGLPAAVPVTSPTFALVNRYDGARLPIWHLDLYRVQGADELEAVGLRDLLGSSGVVVIEWADRAPEAVPQDALWIEIDDDPTDRASRRLRFSRRGVATVPRR